MLQQEERRRYVFFLDGHVQQTLAFAGPARHGPLTVTARPKWPRPTLRGSAGGCLTCNWCLLRSWRAAPISCSSPTRRRAPARSGLRCPWCWSRGRTGWRWRRSGRPLLRKGGEGMRHLPKGMSRKSEKKKKKYGAPFVKKSYRTRSTQKLLSQTDLVKSVPM